MNRAYTIKSQTYDNLPAKLYIKLEVDKEERSTVVILKTYFSYTGDNTKVIRRVKNLFYCKEIIILKIDTLFQIANLAYEFLQGERSN